MRVRSIASGINSLSMLSGTYETREKVSAPYEECGWVHACLKPKGRAVASVPLELWIGDPTKDPNARVATEKDTPLVALFNRPNGWQTMAQFFEAGALHRSLDGEDFWLLLDDLGMPVKARGPLQIATPTQILPVRGRFVTPILNQLGLPVEWTFSPRGGHIITVPRESIIHFKDYDPDDWVRGLGDVDAALSDLDLEWQATRYQRSLLRNSGDPGGMILIDEQLSPAAQSAAENEATANFSVDNAGRWKVVGGKSVKYQPFNVTPKDMQYGEMLKWIRDKVAGICGVPLPVIGVLDNATLANFQQSVELFWKGGNGICSYLRSVEDVINNVFLRRIDDPLAPQLVARFNLKDVQALQEDKKLQYEIALKLAQANVGLSIEESMKLVGLEVDTKELPFSDVRLVPNSLVPLASAVGTTDDGAESDTALPLEPKQIVSLIDILDRISNGALDPAAAIALIVTAFPSISEEQAAKIVAGVNVIGPQQAPATNPNDEPKPPAGGGDGDGETPATDPGGANDGEDPASDSAKALTREQPPSARDAAEEAFASRRSYWKALESRVLVHGEAALRQAYVGKRGWRRKYEAAQLARIEAAARAGAKALAARGAAPVRKDDVTDPKRHVTESDVRDLLLNQREWALKMEDAFRSKVEDIFKLAASDMADELDANLLAPTDPRVVRFLTQQVLNLAEDHTNTLADRVRAVLIRELEKASPAGTIQEAVAEVLPELTDALKQSFSDRDNRANTIARTETAKAANGARYLQMADAGVSEQEWVTSGDAAVRGTPGGPYADSEFSHYELDGKTAQIGEEFDHANHPGLKHPSDPDGAAGDVIGCRCAARAVKKD